MKDEDHAARIGAAVSQLNGALEDARRAGVRAVLACVVEKSYDHTDRIEMRDVTKSLMPRPKVPPHPHWYDSQDQRPDKADEAS